MLESLSFSSVLSIHIWIVLKFLANAGGFAMSRQYLGFVWQHAEMAQAVDDAEHTSSRKVGSADGGFEEGVACECYVLSLTVESYRSIAMTWCLDDGKLMVAKLDDLVVFEKMSDGWKLGVEFHLIERFGLLAEILHQFLIAL